MCGAEPVGVAEARVAWVVELVAVAGSMMRESERLAELVAGIKDAVGAEGMSGETVVSCSSATQAATGSDDVLR
jgi:hypothetical protein